MQHFRVKNFDKFQHYKDRNPPWIKLHRELLKNYEFSCLQDASKAHLLLIWLLASQMENRIPYDEKWLAGQLGTTQKINLDELKSAGFILLINDVADCLHPASDVIADCQQSASPSVSVSLSEGFNSFWDIYPRKENKKKAEQVWRTHALHTKAAAIIADVESRKLTHRSWLDGFIPHATTYLNGERWNDVIDQSPPRGTHGNRGKSGGQSAPERVRAANEKYQ